MTPTNRSTARFPQVLPLALVLALPLSPAYAADTAAGQFTEWAADATVTRSMTLRELGFRQPLTLSGQESQREIYLPVPAGVPTRDAQLQLDGRYVRGHTGRSSGLWSVDGDPVAARSITDAQGDASQLLAIDGLPRDNGFVRVAVGWWSVVSDYRCADQSAPANVLRLSPDSRFSYRFDGRAVNTVAKAWGALPTRVRVLVDGKALQAPAYDAAWRVGAALRNGGKQVDVVALPAVGSTVDLTGISIPASLQGVPAYAALAAGGTQHRIASLAEVGALLSLRDSGPLAIDVAISTDPLRAGVRAALDALATEVGASGGDAASAFTAWRGSDMAALEKGTGTASVSVAAVAGRPTLVVAANAGAKVAGLLSEQWRAYALGHTLQVAEASPAPVGDNAVLLSRLGDIAGTLDIVTRGDRTSRAPSPPRRRARSTRRAWSCCRAAWSLTRTSTSRCTAAGARAAKSGCSRPRAPRARPSSAPPRRSCPSPSWTSTCATASSTATWPCSTAPRSSAAGRTRTSRSTPC